MDETWTWLLEDTVLAHWPLSQCSPFLDAWQNLQKDTNWHCSSFVNCTCLLANIRFTDRKTKLFQNCMQRFIDTITTQAIWFGLGDLSLNLKDWINSKTSITVYKGDFRQFSSFFLLEFLFLGLGSMLSVHLLCTVKDSLYGTTLSWNFIVLGLSEKKRVSEFLLKLGNI